jgi:AraC-like DNA-binding protein
VLLLDTAGLPHADRAEAIYAAMMGATAPCRLIHEDPSGDVHARMDLWEFGPATVWHNAASGIRMLRTARQAAQDTAPIVALGLQHAGPGRFVQAGTGRALVPGDLLLSDLSAAYDYSWTGDGAAYAFQLPLERLGLPIDVVRRAAPRLPASPLYELVHAQLVRLTAGADRLSADPGAAALGAATAELVRALITSAAGDGGSLSPGASAAGITSYVDRHLADPGLGAGSVAGALNMSQRQLYAVCAREGISLEQHIIGRRLEAVRADLARPGGRHRPIGVVARRWGFADPTHFGRRFRAAYGVTPGQWRRASLERR